MTDTSETSTYRYVVTAGATPDYETRHEAIGALARFGDWEADEVVPITESCLTRLHRYPEHLGNKYYGDRDYLATTHGPVRLNREDLVRFWNDAQQEVVETTWEADCPVCYQTHRVEGPGEDARSDLITAVLGCCDAEWFPPADWVADCPVCGTSHRGVFECRPVAYREPFPGVEKPYACARCGWDGEGSALTGPGGECPNCESTAVQVVSES